MAIPVILDCDPGTDDAFALLLALASPEIEVLAVTVAGGNVGLTHTLPNTLGLMALAGADIPVHAGADRPMLGAFVSEEPVHGADGRGGIVLPKGRPASAEPAIDAIRRILRSATQPVVLWELDPRPILPLRFPLNPRCCRRSSGSS